jgi:phosphoglycolate phosphatase-like HAD superfamily hydrolase
MNLDLEQKENILWDFDGVILDSMSVRDYGFVEIFKAFKPKDVEALLEFHKKNGGWSRYVKIEHFFKNIVKIEYTQDDIQDYANRFSKIMLSKLTDKSNIIEDAYLYIKNNYLKKKFHIVSGSDGVELNFLCKELGLDDYFISIHGSPTAKKTLIKNLLSKHNYNTNDTCIIGDSINDYEAGIDNGISFFGYNNDSLINKDKYIHSFY